MDNKVTLAPVEN